MTASGPASILPLISLLLGATTLNVGFGLQASLLGLRAHAEAFSMTQTGLVMANYYLGFILGTRFCPNLVQRVGHIRTFAAMATLASTMPLLHAMLVSPEWWIPFRLLTGFCFAGLSLVVESWLNAQTGSEVRGRVFSIYMVSILCGTAGGQFLLNLSSPMGYDLFVLISVLVSLSLIPVVLTSSPMPPFQVSAPITLGHLFRETPLGVVGCFVSGLLLGSFWSLGAIYARGRGMDVSGVALFMFFFLLGGILIQWPLGRLSDRVDRRLVMAVQNLCLVVGAYGLVGEEVKAGAWNFYAVAALVGGLTLPLYALSVAHANDFLERDEFVPAGARLLLMYGLGAVVGPLASGELMVHWGAGGLFIPSMVCGGGLSLYAFYRITRRVQPMETENFIGVTGTSHMAYVMDPRSSAGEDGGKQAEAPDPTPQSGP